MDMKIKIKGVEFRNPIIIASGPAGFGEEFFKYVLPSEIGGFTTKTVTLSPKEGNAPPRIVYVKDGILNSIGLQNPGIEAFESKVVPNLPNGTTRIISIGGDSPNDFSELARRIESFCDMLEINLSCPNVHSHDVIAADEELSKDIVTACRESTNKPIIVKISPDLDVVEQSRVVVESGADIVNIANSLRGAKFNVETGQAFLKRISGGVSGPAFMPIILWKVYQVKEAFPSLPIIGLGGVTCSRDVVEYAIAGASLVGIGTEAMINPTGIPKIVKGIAEFLEQKNVNFKDVVGISHKGGFK